MQFLVEVVGDGRDVLVLADQDGDVVQLHPFCQQPLHFGAQGEQGLFRVVVLLVRWNERGFDVAVLLFLRRFLRHVGVCAFQGDALFVQFLQMQRVEVLHSSGENPVVEVDDACLASPVGLQGLYADGERARE